MKMTETQARVRRALPRKVVELKTLVLSKPKLAAFFPF
jgi:hypothetical protein